jgi:AAA15 family ATPase/GTPase
VNVLIGANGSGKTALLEAIGMLSAATSGTVDDEALQRRGVHLTTPQLYKSSFKDIGTHHIGLSVQYADENEIWHYAVKLEHRHQNPEHAWAYQEESLKLNDKLILQRHSNQLETYGAFPVKHQYAYNTYEGANAAIHFALSQTASSKLFS